MGQQVTKALQQSPALVSGHGHVLSHVKPKSKETPALVSRCFKMFQECGWQRCCSSNLLNTDPCHKEERGAPPEVHCGFVQWDTSRFIGGVQAL